MQKSKNLLQNFAKNSFFTFYQNAGRVFYLKLQLFKKPDFLPIKVVIHYPNNTKMTQSSSDSHLFIGKK